MNTYELPPILTVGVSSENGLLKFRDQETFDKVLKSLEEENIKWSRQFKENWKDLSEEEFENKFDELKFDPDLPLKSFEEELKFSSLRNQIADKMELWLDNEELDLENNPDNHYIDGDYLRTVLNSDLEIMIGSSIYKILENGLVYEITNGDFSLLNKIYSLKSPEDLFFDKNIIIHNCDELNKSSSCKVNQSSSGSKNYKTDRLVIYRITVTNAVFTHYVKATTKSYKRKRRRWRRYNTTVKARVYGAVYNNTDCSDSNQHSVNSGTVSKSSDWNVKAKVSFGYSPHVKKNELHSYHYCNGWSKYFSLTW